MELLYAKLEVECKPYLENDQFVFKACYGTIVVLEKPDLGFESNESRKGVVDKDFAKFRCNGLWCRDIIDVKTMQHKTMVKHRFGCGEPTLYKVGQFIRPDAYAYDLNKICAQGLHYFLTLKPALHYRYLAIDGERFQWTNSGSLLSITECKNGKDIKQTIFKEDGTIKKTKLITYPS